MRVAFYTLGCKVNHYESQAMLEAFLAAGYEEVSFSDAAEIYVINTCTVTAVSDQKSRQMIARAHRSNPNGVIIAVGCYAQTSPEIVSQLPGVSLVIGNDRKAEIVSLAEEAARSAAVGRCMVADLNEPRPFENLSAVADSRTRATLKIQDGCRNFCTYCAIPYARGTLRSRPLSDLLGEVRRLVLEGYREIVLTGIHLTSWGKDSGEGDLNTVLRAVAEIPGDYRIRLGSLEPSFCDETFAETLKTVPQICPQFHLSLQSGSDGVLRRMNRHYTTSRYLESVELLRDALPGCAITTDVIAGFPGETEEQHRETLQFLERVGFARVHVFPYSRRAGTAADRMDGHLPKTVREHRAAELKIVADRTEMLYIAAMKGKDYRVLLETCEEGYSENYVRTRLLISEGQPLPKEGTVVPVTIEYTEGDTAYGCRIVSAERSRN